MREFRRLNNIVEWWGRRGESTLPGNHQNRTTAKTNSFLNLPSDRGPFRPSRTKADLQWLHAFEKPPARVYRRLTCGIIIEKLALLCFGNLGSALNPDRKIFFLASGRSKSGDKAVRSFLCTAGFQTTCLSLGGSEILLSPGLL